jgi:solute carrier family 35 protein F1/2
MGYFSEWTWERLWTFLSEEAVWRGQLLSLLVAGSGIFATMLADMHPTGNFPTFMGFLNYTCVALFVFYTYYLDEDKPAYRVEDLRPSRLQNQWWLYLIGAVLDVEANFCVTLAYSYTNITSVMLLDCFTIPCVMILSRGFLKARYVRNHYIGTALAIAGMACIIANDTKNSDDMDDALLGDLLVVGGVSLYACSNVLQEAVMKTDAREEYLVIMPGFASVISMLQCLLLEAPRLVHLDWRLDTALFMTGFVFCMFFFYLNVSRLLVCSDSALFNLSLLTSDVYAVLFSVIFTGAWVSWMYLLAFFFVCIGIYIYHNEKSPTEAGVGLLADSDEMTPVSGGERAGQGTILKYDHVRVHDHMHHTNPLRRVSGDGSSAISNDSNVDALIEDVLEEGSR